MKTTRQTRSQLRLIEQQKSEIMAQSKQKSENSDLPILPDVRLVPLPFYDVEATLLQPTSLMPLLTNNSSVVKFSLTPLQINLLNQNRVIVNGIVDYQVQVQLRLCLSETTSEQKDLYPLDLCVRVNDKECPLPPPLATRPGQPIKRLQLPLNISSLVKYSSTVSNKVQINWKAEPAKKFAVSVYLVRKLDSKELMKRLLTKGIKPAEYTRSIIKEKFEAEEADNEVAISILRVSLACPLMAYSARMSNPARASTCKHLQCFDVSTFLYMNEKKATWKCPVCDQPALFKDLAIDEYFLGVINSPNLGDDNEIQLHKDGTWSPLSQKNEKKPKLEKTIDKSIEIISDDDDDVPPSAAPVKNQKTKTTDDIADSFKNDMPEQVKNKISSSVTELPRTQSFQPVEKKRAKRITSTRSMGLKRVKTSSNISEEHESNSKDSGIDSEEPPNAPNTQDLISQPKPSSLTIDLTLDD